MLFLFLFCIALSYHSLSFHSSDTNLFLPCAPLLTYRSEYIQAHYSLSQNCQGITLIKCGDNAARWVNGIQWFGILDFFSLGYFLDSPPCFIFCYNSFCRFFALSLFFLAVKKVEGREAVVPNTEGRRGGGLSWEYWEQWIGFPKELTRQSPNQEGGDRWPVIYSKVITLIRPDGCQCGSCTCYSYRLSNLQCIFHFSQSWDIEKIFLVSGR